MTSDLSTPSPANGANGHPAWHALPPEFASARLESDPKRGLSSAEALRRLAVYGHNRSDPRPGSPPGLLQIAGAELLSPPVLIVVGLAVLLLAMAAQPQALLAAGTGVVLLATRVIYRLQVQRTLAILQQRAQQPAIVRRDGLRRQIPPDEVVPGDLLLLEHGRLVPAEGRLVNATSLQVCYPQAGTRRARLDKSTDAVLDHNTPPEERSTMVHPGMLVCRGVGSAIVVATGQQAVRLRDLQTISPSLTGTTAAQRRYDRWARWLTGLAVIASLLLPALGWWQGQLEPPQALSEALGLAFALLPLEGVAIIGLLLALGAERLSKRQAQARDLQAVETLSAVNTILSSKTGLLTDGQLQVQRTVPAAWNRQLMEIALMTTITEIEPVVEPGEVTPGLESGYSGPQETALLRAAAQAGLEVAALRANRPVEAWFQLDPLRRRMSVVYRRGVRHWVSVRGAPEAVLDVCTRRWTVDGIDHLTEVDRKAIFETAAVLAEGGGRVIALAERSLSPEEARRPLSPAGVERELNFAGLLALTDTIRPESARTIRQCRQAGIQVLLVTGDHPVAARAAGLQSELAEPDTRVLTGRELAGLEHKQLQAALSNTVVLAQINPWEKLKVLQTLQQEGGCVAATGRYLLEAPVLAAADLGVTVEDNASDAAHLAADLVLMDGRINTLVQAIAVGRWMYANLSKTLSLYLGAKLGLLMSATLPVVLGLPLLLSVPQLLLIGLTLGAAVPLLYAGEPAEDALMQLPPRRATDAPFTALMTARLLRSALSLFLVLIICYFGSLIVIGDLARARMLVFVGYLLMMVLIAYSLRSDTRSLIRLNPVSNLPLFIWALVTLGLALGLANIPAAAGWVGGAALSLLDWIIGLLSLGVGLLFMGIRKWVASRGLRR